MEGWGHQKSKPRTSHSPAHTCAACRHKQSVHLCSADQKYMRHECFCPNLPPLPSPAASFLSAFGAHTSTPRPSSPHTSHRRLVEGTHTWRTHVIQACSYAAGHPVPHAFDWAALSHFLAHGPPHISACKPTRLDAYAHAHALLTIEQKLVTEALRSLSSCLVGSAKAWRRMRASTALTHKARPQKALFRLRHTPPAAPPSPCLSSHPSPPQSQPLRQPCRRRWRRSTGPPSTPSSKKT